MNERIVILEMKPCGRCHKPVPITFTAKDICRNCGNYWRSEEEIKLEAAQGKTPQKMSPFKLIFIVIIMGIISALIAVGLVTFLNKQRLSESMAISSSIKVALDDYVSENKVYPEKIENWSDIVYICNLNIRFKNAPLKPRSEDAGMKFIKYAVMDSGRSYKMRLAVRGLPQKTKGKIIEISPSGLKKLTGQELN